MLKKSLKNFNFLRRIYILYDTLITISFLKIDFLFIKNSNKTKFDNITKKCKFFN